MSRAKPSSRELGADVDATSVDGFERGNVRRALRCACRRSGGFATKNLALSDGKGHWRRSRAGIAARYGERAGKLEILSPAGHSHAARQTRPRFAHGEHLRGHPLHCAAARSTVAVKPLLNASLSRFSASVNAQDASGATPLHWAAYGSVASIRSVERRDADAAQTADGARPLHVAAGAGRR